MCSSDLLTIPPTDFNIPRASTMSSIFMCQGFWIRLPDGSYVHTNADADEVEAGAQCALVSKISNAIAIHRPESGAFVDMEYTNGY